jgi:hypothetical protein
MAVLLGFQLHSLAKDVGFSRDRLVHAFRPGAAEVDSLPPQIIDALALVRSRSQGPDTVSLSPSLVSDALLMQRATEALYPVRVENRVGLLLAPTGVSAAPGCRVASRQRTMELYECPIR